MPVPPPSAAFDSLKERRRKRKSRPTLEDLRSQVAELESLQEQFGAPEIEQDQPGVFKRIIDVLSRPNFAIAGFVEEVGGEEPSVARGVKRALTEIFSGVGDIQGEKRAFGEVLENLGVGTVTLADAFPALEGTWVGNFGSRGAAGLALDIFTDPLTYVTFGASSGIRIATSKGVRFLNKSGAEKFTELVRRNRNTFRETLPVGDAVAETRIASKAITEAEKQFEKAFTVGDDISEELLEKGGAKIFGAKIPGSDRLGEPLKRAMSMLPESVSKPAIEGAEQMRLGMRRMVNGIFSPEGPLANLPDPIRTRAVRLTNDFFRSSTAHRAHLMSRVAPLERRYRKLARKDPKIGERWYDVREGELPRSTITDPDELQLFDETMQLYEEMGKTLLDHGVLRSEQILPNYIFHQYKNIEDLAQYHPRPGVVRPGTKARIEKQRRFDTYRVAQEESERLHDLSLKLMSRNEANRLYPVLEPNFDVFENMRSYVGLHSDALARKAWREEMVEQFAKVDPGAAAGIRAADFDGLYDEVPVKPKDTPGAPKDFSPENVPIKRVIDEGDIESTLRDAFGPDGAQYVAVKSKQTDNELIYLPKAIADAMEDVNASLFNTRQYKEFGKLLRGFDWINNNFKWGVYTIWPASATRDGYSNIALSMLRIGMAALDPKRHVDAIRLMAGKELKRQFANSGFTIGQLRDLSKTLGVWVPGQVFVEQTGRFKLGRARRALTEARAGIENEARVLLWMEEIRRGADPRIAADTVGEFLFNYGEVSRVERDLFRRLIPFYTFTRKNVERQWKSLKSKPGLVINQIKPFRPRDSESEMMVKWEAEGLGIRLDRDGKTVHAIQGIDLPLRNLDTLWAGGFGATGRRLMGMITPVLKVPIESITGRDFFTGGDLGRVPGGSVGRLIDVTGTPKAVKDWLGYKKEVDAAGRPRYSFDGRRYSLLVRSWMFSRLVSTSDRQFREYLGDDNIAAALLDLGTGLRAKEINLDEQTERKLRRRIRQLQQSLVRRGVFEEFRRPFQRKNVEVDL